MHARVLVTPVAAIKAALSSQGLKLLEHARVVVEPAVYRLERKTRAEVYDRIYMRYVQIDPKLSDVSYEILCGFLWLELRVPYLYQKLHFVKMK